MYPEEVIGYFSKWFSSKLDSTELLELGKAGPYVRNIVTILLKLGYRVSATDTFNQSVCEELRKFQCKYKHRCVDGKFGPGTRTLLVRVALDELGANFLTSLPPAFPSFYSAFISYAWCDALQVNGLDQWLQDRHVVIRRDIRDFKAGRMLDDEIKRYLHLSDKVFIVYSKEARSRDWPEFERFMAREVETLRGLPCLIYVLLDDTKPPQYESKRIYVDAVGKPLKDIGAELLHAVTGQVEESIKFDYNENDPL